MSNSPKPLKDAHSSRQLAGGSGTAAVGHGGENSVGGGSGLHTAIEAPHSTPTPPTEAGMATALASPSVMEGRGLVVTQADQDVGSDLSGDLMAKLWRLETK